MEVLGPAPEQLTQEQILEVLRDPLGKIITDQVDGDSEAERVYQLRQAQKSDFYWRGIQYIAPTQTTSGMAVFSPVGSPINNLGSDSKDTSGWNDYVQNIYRGYGRKLIAVLGQRIPNVKAVPDNPDDQTMDRVAGQADIAAQILHNQWKLDVRILELMLHLWKSGTAFAYTPWVTDALKYGVTEQPIMDAEQEGDMSLPVTKGTQKFANGAVELVLANVMTVSTPFFARDLDSTPWLKYEYEEFKSKLKSLYPQLRKQPPTDSTVGGDNASGSVGTMVRDSAASPQGIAAVNRSNRWTYTRVWIKPEMYEQLEDGDALNLMREHFSDGMKVTKVSGEIVDIENEKLTDVWAYCKPEVSEYIFADALGTDMLSIQDLRNNVMNLARDTFEGGIPLTFADPRVIDVDYWNRNPAVPNAIIPTLPGQSGQIGNGFYQTEPTKLNEQTMPWIQMEENSARVNVGATEAIYGAGGGGGGETAHQAELQKNAALQQLGMTWVFIRKFVEQVTHNGVRQLAKFGSGVLTNVKKGMNGYTSKTLDIAELLESGYHFECEESFPMSYAEKRAHMMWLLGLGPEIATSMGLTHPRNVTQLHDLFGFTGLYNPAVQQHEKAMSVIQQLIQGKPIQQPQPDGSTKLVPSIPADQFEDKHDFMAEEARAWCTDPDNGLRVRATNPDGYQNVVAWGQAHLELSPPPPTPPPPPSVRLNVSAKANELMPDQLRAIEEKAGVAPQGQPSAPGAAPGQPPVPPQGQPPTGPPPNRMPPVPKNITPPPGAGTGSPVQPPAVM